jgi:hypothetical protein
MAAEPLARGPLPLVKREEDLLTLALEAAARSGDADPELVQHVVGSREEVSKTTGSWVSHSHEPSYLIAMRGNFSGRRSFPPGRKWDHRRGEIESWPIKVLVVEIESGRVTDFGGGHTYPDLSSVRPVITDYRESQPAKAPGWRRVFFRGRRRRVIARAKRITDSLVEIEVKHHGGVAVGSPGRARLEDREGGLADLIWELVEKAGWVGQHTAQLNPVMSLAMCVPAAPGRSEMPSPRVALLPGGPRRMTEVGRVREDGSVLRRYHGDLHPQASLRGVVLVESENRREDFDIFENMLYAAAVRTGWLSGNRERQEAALISGVEIVVGATVQRH